jgi:putative ABC transport system permease protein
MMIYFYPKIANFSSIMIRNFIKIAWRNLLLSKVYSLIAIFGLAIGLSVSILLFWGVNDELVYNTQFRDAIDIYRLNAKVKMGPATFDTWTNTPAPISAFGVKELPSIQDATRYEMRQSLVTVGDNHFVEENSAFTEASFFRLFHTNFVKGNAQTAFKNINNMVVSQTEAIKLFGSADKAMDKIVQLGEKLNPYVISAVMEDMPQRSSVRMDMLLSLDVVRKDFEGNGKWKTIDEDWGNYTFTTFFKLQPGANVRLLEKQLTDLGEKNNEFVKPGDIGFILQPLNTLRLYNPDMTPAGIRIINYFIIIGILILVIAVINYINLSTARATKRAKEVGLRRVVGAIRNQLIMQFVIEFVLIFAASVVLAAILIPIMVPFYQQISGKDYPIDYWQPSTLKITAWVGFGTIVLGCIYPAWVLSSFNPIEVLKSNFSKSSKGGWLRKSLVILQFTFSVVLIICTVVIDHQLQYIQTKNLGYNRDNVMLVDMNATMGQHWEPVINELKENKNIEDVSVAMGSIMQLGSSTDNIDWPGKTGSGAHISPMQVRANFTSMMKMQFAQGEGFTGTPADSAYYLLNEAAVKLMELKHPLGTVITLWGRPGQIRGVLKDFNHASLKTDINPVIFRAARTAEYGGTLYVKIKSENAQAAVGAVERIYHVYNPVKPFQYHFMNDDFDAMYRYETQTGELFRAFAVVAILLSCLGLFGLAVFTAERRTREIGIRKVLGGSITSISILISREFAALVVVANVIAWPVAWYLSNQWLQAFAYKITISWWVFAVSGLISIILSVLTVSSQAIKAARVNPVKSLRAE